MEAPCPEQFPTDRNGAAPTAAKLRWVPSGWNGWTDPHMGQRWCASLVSPAFGQPTETKKALTVVAI